MPSRPSAPPSARAARVRAGALAALATSAIAPTLAASPWTLKQHEVVAGLDVNFASSTNEFLNDGSRQRYPLEGEFISSTYSLTTRYGITDRLEIDAALQIKAVSFDIDPVLLDAEPIVRDFTFEKAQGVITDFATQDLGVGDLNVAMRYKVLDASYFLVTPQVGVKIPMGYRPPRETFDKLELTLEDPSRGFLLNDDVTLGDGQIDLHAGLLLGAYLPATRTFARIDLLYNHRFGAPGDQVIFHPKVGQFAWKGLLFFGGARWVETIFEGRPIGTTFVDRGNQQDPATFTLAEVDTPPLFLDRSYTFIEAGVLLVIDEVSLQAYVQETLAGENYADLRIVGFSALVSVPGATAPAPPAPSEEVVPEYEEVYEEAPAAEELTAPEPAPTPAPPEEAPDGALPVEAPIVPAPAPIDPS